MKLSDAADFFKALKESFKHVKFEKMTFEEAMDKERKLKELRNARKFAGIVADSFEKMAQERKAGK